MVDIQGGKLLKLKEDLAIGLDIGGTKIRAALISENGEIIDSKQCATLNGQGEKVFINQIISLIGELIQEMKVNRNRIRGIGIATAGVIDSKNKKIIFANNLGVKNFPIGDLLEKYFKLPVRIYNDANAGAVGEWLWGGGKGKENLIYITVSTGIGAGIISNGRLVTGSKDSAGEFGHMSIDFNGPLCPCGNRGCLENYASGTAITRMARERLKKNRKNQLVSLSENEVTAIEVSKAASKGDSFSIELLDEVAEYLGIGIINLIHLFNPEVVILGGGVMNDSELLLLSIKRRILDRGIFEMVRHVNVHNSVLGKNASVIGSVGMFFNELTNKLNISV